MEGPYKWDFSTPRPAIPEDITALISQLMNLPVWKFEILRREMAELLCDDEMGDEY
jgi:hypothetical protein